MDIQETPNHQRKVEPIASVGGVGNPIDLFGKITILVVVIELILVVVLNIYENNQITTINNKLTTAQDTLVSSNYASLNSQVNTVLAGQQQLSDVLDSKVYWPKFYTLLNGITPSNIQLNSMTIDQDGSFTATGQASDLSELAQMIKAWSSGVGSVATPFSSVALSNNGYSTGANSSTVVTFTVTGQVNIGALNQ